MANPTCTIVVWNIENMGLYRQKATTIFQAKYGHAPKEGDEAKLKGIETSLANSISTFIKLLIIKFQIDVMVIQELKFGGLQMLNNIVTSLNKISSNDPYLFDFIPAYSPTDDHLKLRGEEDLEKRATKVSSILNDEYTEGYGLIIRKRFCIQPDYATQSYEGYMDHCYQSCGVVKADSSSSVPFATVTSTLDFPNPGLKLNFVKQACRTVAAAEKIVRTSLNISSPSSNQIAVKTAAEVTDFGARRPCKVRINFGRAGICLLTYHGHRAVGTDNHTAIYGANLAVLAKEIEENNVILAGDFNIINGNDITSIYNALLAGKGYSNLTWSPAKSAYQETRFKPENGECKNGAPLDVLFTNCSSSSGVPIGKGTILINIPHQMNTNIDSLMKPLFEKTELRDLAMKYFKNQANPNARKLISYLNRNVQPDLEIMQLLYFSLISDHLPLRIKLELQ